MDLLLNLFPNAESDFPLLAVVLGLPALGALFNGIFGKRVGSPGVRLMALATILGSFAGALIAFVMLLHAGAGSGHHVRFAWHAWRWLVVGATPIEVTFSVDNLSSVMALVVTGVGALIHVYATGYMREDPGYHRFFAYMNLFIFAMLVLVLGDSLPILFVGWEGVGLCSYLLIGFWFEEGKNAAAGNKAFIANRVGDFGLLVAMAMIAYYVQSLSWGGIEAGSGRLLTSVRVFPFDMLLPKVESFATNWLPNSAGAWVVGAMGAMTHVSAVTLVCLALLLGCTGKSAQIPLYVWLPDAMAGPTPVSALIHAATMVTAGVYLVARMSMVFMLSPTAMVVMATIGALTALAAAVVGLAQNDIKKVLAYSTISQLGFMFMAVGVGAFAAGIFHLVTHAFFKAALFLCSGAVIHAMHARIHDTDGSQDMRNMGGLRRFMPRTFVSYCASTAAIAGLPLTAGFFSKDKILFHILMKPSEVFGAKVPAWYGTVLFGVGVTAATLTALYMVRSLVLTFFGEFRGWQLRPQTAGAGASHWENREVDQEGGAGPAPHEAPASMTLPVLALAVLALVGGYINADALVHLPAWLDQWLAPVFGGGENLAAPTGSGESATAILEDIALAGGVTALLVGGCMGWWIYVKRGGEPARALANGMPRLYALVRDKWRIDELYEHTIIGFAHAMAETCAKFDRWVVDGIVGKMTALVVALVGTVLRAFQNGKVQAYATVMVVGLVAVGGFLVLPHGDVAVEVDKRSGNYVLRAPPGIGYRYRWDLDGDGKWDTGDDWTLREASDLMPPNEPTAHETRSVRVEVRSAFGLSTVTALQLRRGKNQPMPTYPTGAGDEGMNR